MSEDINNPAGRRSFFKLGMNKVAKAGVDAVEKKVKKRAEHWVRPPFALSELDFLLACTRCNACIDACPHGVVFSLSAKRGIDVVGTPALDILNKGCHLCSDWPCVTSCKDGALTFNVLEKLIGEGEDGQLDITEGDQVPPKPEDCPPFAKAYINKVACLPWQGPECGACMGSCPILDTLVWHREKPEILLDSCIGCGQCREVCIASPNAIDIRPAV